MRLLTPAILLAAITLASANPRHTKRQAEQSHWVGQKSIPDSLSLTTENQNLHHVSFKPIGLAGISEPASQNLQFNQITADQILKQFQQSATNPAANIYEIPNLQSQLLQPTPSQTQLNYNTFNPATYYITNPNPTNPNLIQNAVKVQEQTSGAEVKPVQHSSVVNHGSYMPFESLSVDQGPFLTTQYKRPQSQHYAPVQLNLPAQPYALPQPQLQTHFVPEKRPQYQVQPQQLPTPNVYNFLPRAQKPGQPQQLVTPNVYNFVPQAQKTAQPSPNVYKFQPQTQKPVSRINNAPYHPLSAVLNPYQPQKALPNPSTTPPPFHAKPQSFENVVQKHKPNTTPSRDSSKDDARNESEEENEDPREYDDDENVSKEEYRYRDEEPDDNIDEVDSREYRPSFQAARYIFNRDGESEEDDEDSSSSNIYPKPIKHHDDDDNPFSKHYGNEHNKYLARYKKSRYYKPKKNKDPTYELEGKSSQHIPIALRNQKLVEEKWLVTKESRKEQ